MPPALILVLLALLGGCGRSSEAPRLEVLSPDGELWLSPGETFEVAASAGAGSRVEVLLPGEAPVPLEEMEPGIFRGLLRATPRCTRLQIRSGSTRLVRRVRLLGAQLPVAEITAEGAVLRSGPDAAFERLDPLPRGLRAPVSGRRGPWYRLEPVRGWVEERHLRLLEPGSAPSRPVLRSLRVEEDAGGGALLRLRLGDPAPWQVREELESRRMVLVLPGALAAMGEVTFPPEPRRVEEIRILPGEESTRVVVVLGPEGLWGYRLTWREPELLLRLTPPPRPGWGNPPDLRIPVDQGTEIPPPAPLKGIRVVLDPGHGGEDLGAVGVAGTREKDLNLRTARAVAEELERAGARVAMTRREDREVAGPGASAEEELAARVRAAEEAGGQLFLSLHYNARPETTLARVAHGTHVYYYHPQSRALARSLAGALAEAIGEPDHAHLWRSFHVIRQTAMPAVLVEVNFLSNPEEERRMLEPAYPASVARGIRKGLEGFLRKAARNGA